MLRRLAPGLAFVVILAAPLDSQSLRSKVEDLFRFGSGCGPDVLLCLYSNLPGVHGEHFNTALAQGEESLVGFLANAIGTSVSNVPISAASSSVTFTFEGGLPVKTSVSAGPIFAERAQTLGRGRVLIGGNATSVNFQSLRGVPLTSIVFDFTHQDTGAPGLGNPEFENDIFEVRPVLDVNVLVASVFLTYGLLDRVDVGVAVPLVNTSLTGRSLASLRLFGVSDSSPHYFGDSANAPVSERQQEATSSVEGSATGIGDIAARVKVNLKQSERTGFAMLVDARFPTGNEDDFLGAGDFAVRGLGIVSARWGDFSPHGNLGYLFRSGDLQTDAVLATAGFDQLVAPWATVAVDLITAWEVGESKVKLPGPTTIDTPFVRVVQTSNIPDGRDHIIDASLGAKFTSRRGFTFIANTIFPIRKSGMQANVVFTAGLEYNF